MRTPKYQGVCLAAMVALGMVSTAAVAANETTRVIVAFKPGAAAATRAAVAAARGAVKHEIFGMDAMAVEVPTPALQGLQRNPNVEYVEEDATSMHLKEGFADANIIFFLLHELPHDLKVKTLSEAGRMLAPGGKLYLGEFHKPTPLVLKCLSWSYFKVFEPLGLALWDSHDPVTILENMGGWTVERQTFFFDNFQIITATKH